MNLNEKIEERNEDLIKLRKKITGTVQVLTHVKEKLQFMQVSVITMIMSSVIPMHVHLIVCTCTVYSLIFRQSKLEEKNVI